MDSHWHTRNLKSEQHRKKLRKQYLLSHYKIAQKIF